MVAACVSIVEIHRWTSMILLSVVLKCLKICLIVVVSILNYQTVMYLNMYTAPNLKVITSIKILSGSDRFKR